MESQTNKKKFFDHKIFSSRVKTADVKLFPEAALGYLIGPVLAMSSNAVVNSFLAKYWNDVLGLGTWAPMFPTILLLVSTIFIVIGNLLVGRLMDRKPSIAGKARPLILMGMPLIGIALLVLFLVPFPKGATLENPNILTLSMISIGYNLYYAVAYPFYYTSHASLVNLSTRDSGKRSLLATASNAAQLGAIGLASMIGPFLIGALGLLDTSSEAAREAANSKWIILMIVMLTCFLIGAFVEYSFTRERITEESIKLMDTGKEGEEVEVKKVPTKTQVKICTHDKYWWMMIVFFFLYQFGGMLKNNDAIFYSQYLTGPFVEPSHYFDLQGTINIVGAIPTALGMVVIWPLANKFGKANSIKVGSFMAFFLGLTGFLVLPFGNSLASVNTISIAAFCLKALGTVPAMYISLALLSDILDHQEALYGKRTDGFTMAVYGSIMVATAGIANALIYGINNSIDPSNLELLKNVHTFLFFGGESLCYLIMGIMFLFMNVEKFGKIDHITILADQKARVEAEGKVFIEPHVRMLEEQKETEAQIERENIASLKKKCEKKGLDFESELAAYNKAKADKLAASEARKAAAEAKRLEKEQLAKAKYDALSAEEKAKLDAKCAQKAEKLATREKQIEEEFIVLHEKAKAYAQAHNID